MSAWTCRSTKARPTQRLLHPVLGSHDGRALVPIPKSREKREPVGDINIAMVDSLKVLDRNRPIREGDIRPRRGRLAVDIFLFQSCLRHIPQFCLLGIGGLP